MNNRFLFQLIVLVLLFNSVNFGGSGKGRSPARTVSTHILNALSVNNTIVIQREDGTYLVDINYDLFDEENRYSTISVLASTDGGMTWGDYTCNNLTGDVGYNIYPGRKSIVWDFAAEHPNDFQNQLRLKITALNSIGLESEGISNVLIAASIPLAAPILISPLDTTHISTNSLDFVWHKVPNSQGYVIQISTVENFQTCLVNTEVFDTVYTATNLFNGLNYYWRVRAKLNGIEFINWSWRTTHLVKGAKKAGIYIQLLSSKNLNNYLTNYDIVLGKKRSFGEVSHSKIEENIYFFDANNIIQLWNLNQGINEIIIKQNGNRIGHISFEYSNDDKKNNQIRDAILILHDDNEMKVQNDTTYYPYGVSVKYEGRNYFSGWDYYKEGEYPVSMLIPPLNKMPPESEYNKNPILFVHGVSGAFEYNKDGAEEGREDAGYWGSTPRITNKQMNGYAPWQFYYPYDAYIKHNALCLKKGIEWIKTKYNKKVRLVTHSMGGLVAYECIINDSNWSKNNVEKVLFITPPFKGSFAAFRYYHNIYFNGLIPKIITKQDKNAPAYRDLSLGSKFISEIRTKTLPSLNDNDYVYDDYFVLIGTTSNKFKTKLLWDKITIAEEAEYHSDGVVSISSASLLKQGVGFATFYGNHDDGIHSSSNLENRNLIPSIVKNYFDKNTNDFFNALENNNNFKEIDVIVNPADSIRKSPRNNDLKGKDIKKLAHNEWERLHKRSQKVEFGKGLLTLDQLSTVKHYQVFKQKVGNKIYLNAFNNEKGLIIDPSNFSDELGILIKNTEPGNNSYIFNRSGYGSALNLAGNYKVSFVTTSQNNYNNFYPITREIDVTFNKLEENYWNIPLSKKETEIINENLKGNLYSLSPLKESRGASSFHIDNSVTSATFFLSGYEDNPNFSNHQMKLTNPDGVIIDSATAFFNSEKYWFYSDMDFGLAFLRVSDIEPGNWTISWNTNLVGGNATASIISIINIDLHKENNVSLFIGDTLSVYAPLPPDSLSVINPTLRYVLYYTPPGQDTLIFKDSSLCQISDTVFIKNFIADDAGDYTVNYNLSGLYNGNSIERTTIDYFEVLGVLPPDLISPVRDSVIQKRNVNFTWNNRQGAISYDLHYYTDTDTTKHLVEGISDTTYTLSELNYSTKYYWQVRGNTLTSEGLWSNLNHFSTYKPSNIPDSWRILFADTLGTRMAVVMNRDTKVNMGDAILRDGNLVGVFYKNDSLICVGYTEYKTGDINTIFAQGDDPTTTDKEGLYEGEKFYFKVFDLYNREEYIIDFSYMKNNDTIFVSGASVTIDSLVVSQSQIVNRVMKLDKGWNLISYPLIKNPNRMKDLIPNIDGGPYIFDVVSGYVLQDTINPKQGCWIRVSNDFNFTIFGKLIEDTLINVKSGWNIIGGNSYITNKSDIYSQPEGIIISQFWGFDTLGYYLSNEVYYGRGYWVRVSQDGEIVLPRSEELKKRNYLDSKIVEAFKITSDNRKRILYQSENKDRFMLDGPPQSMGNYFDVRYEGNSYVELKDKTAYLVIMNNAKFPVAIEYIADDEEYDVSGAFTKKYYGRLNNENTVLIDNEKDISLVIKKVEIPIDFYLDQNYPNPFNPSTKINFGLPQEQKVKLVVYDILGQEVERIINGDIIKAGNYTIEWNAGKFASGVYILRMKTNTFTSVKKMMLIK